MSKIITVTSVIGKNDVVDKTDGEKLFSAIRKALDETKCKVFVDFSGVGVFTANAGNYCVGQLCKDLEEFNTRIVIQNANRYAAPMIGRVLENAKIYYEAQRNMAVRPSNEEIEKKRERARNNYEISFGERLFSEVDKAKKRGNLEEAVDYLVTLVGRLLLEHDSTHRTLPRGSITYKMLYYDGR